MVVDLHGKDWWLPCGFWHLLVPRQMTPPSLLGAVPDEDNDAKEGVPLA